MVIDVDVATLLQAQLGETFGIGENATIFEICAAIDAQQESIDIAAVLDGLEDTLVPIVTAQISQLVNQIAIAVSEITGEPLNQALIDEILAGIDIDDIVAQITANVEISLEILETCIGQLPPPLTTETLTVIKNIECQADAPTCEQNPIEPSNFTIVIDGNNPSQNNFPGSSTGTNVELEAGAYNVTEQGLDPVTPAICSTMGFEAGRNVSSGISGNLFICTHFSDECEGDLTIGNPQTCTIENVLVEQNFLDLAVANSGSDNVSILFGDGNGTFGMATNFGAGDVPLSVAVGDFDGDTDLDLAVANFVSDNVSILLNNGNGTFGMATNFGVGNQPLSVAVGDFDGDTDLDLAVANFFPASVSILLNNGNGTFGMATNFGAGSLPNSVAVGDFDGDTDLDLAVANFGSNNVSILLNNGNGTFGMATNFGAGDGPQSVAVGDFDGDTDLDLAVPNQNSNNVSVLLNNGNGTFGMATNFGAGDVPLSVAVGDFDGDTDLDLAVANFESNNVSILLNNGNGTFGMATNFGVGGGLGSVAVGDFDGDTDLDLAASYLGSNNVSILLNNGNGTFGMATNFGVGNGTHSVAVGDFN